MPTALITGASGGLGAAIASALVPTHTVLLGGRPSPRLDKVAERLGATTWPLDLTDADSLTAGAEVIDELDVLVHNAGVAFPARLVDSTIDEWRKTLEVNLIGAVALTQALLGALRRAEGQVIFINSGAGLHVLSGMASYSASKFALRAFADALRAEEPTLRVTSLHPGRIATDLQRQLREFEGGDFDPSAYLSPETVAQAVVNVIFTPPDGHVHEVIIRQRGVRTQSTC